MGYKMSSNIAFNSRMLRSQQREGARRSLRVGYRNRSLECRWPATRCLDLIMELDFLLQRTPGTAERAVSLAQGAYHRST